jgi:hypothetical protein
VIRSTCRFLSVPVKRASPSATGSPTAPDSGLQVEKWKVVRIGSARVEPLYRAPRAEPELTHPPELQRGRSAGEEQERQDGSGEGSHAQGISRKSAVACATSGASPSTRSRPRSASDTSPEPAASAVRSWPSAASARLR